MYKDDTSSKMNMKTPMSKPCLLMALTTLFGVATCLAEDKEPAQLAATAATSTTIAVEGEVSVTPAPAPASAPVPVVKETPAPKLSYGLEDVLKLSRANVSEDITLTYIQNSGTIY